jgi:integrase
VASINRGGDTVDEITIRKHLTAREVDRLIQATRGARHEARDRCLLLVTFRHGLRVSEALGLELSQFFSKLTNGKIKGLPPPRYTQLEAIHQGHHRADHLHPSAAGIREIARSLA